VSSTEAAWALSAESSEATGTACGRTRSGTTSTAGTAGTGAWVEVTGCLLLLLLWLRHDDKFIRSGLQG